MSAVCVENSPLNIFLISSERAELCANAGCSGMTVYLWPKVRSFRKLVGRAGGGCGALRSVVSRARLSSLLASRIDLDLQTMQTSDPSQLLWIGPLPGDITEVEAYCRIFRSVEQLHTSLMETICYPETGECPVSYEASSEDMHFLEEQVVAVLGFMLALLSRGREEVLSGRSAFINSFQTVAINTADGRLLPLASFRDEMKRFCESLEIALANSFKPLGDYIPNIWRRLQRLKNVCYDAGFSRSDEFPCPTVFANWAPVFFTTMKEGIILDNHEVAFWRGGQVTDEGLTWLLAEEFKTIVDLREVESNDECYCSAMEQAVSSGKIEVINLPVESGTSPSMLQVEQFAFLVSDPSRKPLYLHSQEGVNRTSAMVSRWRQYIVHAEMNFVKKNAPINYVYQLNTEKFLKDQNLLQINSQNVQGGIIMNAQNDYGLTAVEHLNEEYSDQDVSTSQKENKNKKVTPKETLMDSSVPGHGCDGNGEIFPCFSFKNDPLKAQFPKCDIFSRKEVTRFLQRTNIAPNAYLSYRKKSGNVSMSRTCKFSFETHETPTESDKPQHRGYEGGVNYSFLGNRKHLKDGKSSSLNLGVVGFHEEKINGVLGDEKKGLNNVGSSSCGHTLSTLPEIKKWESGEVSASSTGGNMRASATGVVRVQSRKRAEMFLDRTDRFTCTREKVTESSLAFTHPSTQQQMLMWKSPPKTVLLLKKFGQELIEEAKEVQGDGVIVATPTGSTAYSTAAGGSMVHPNVPCMLFTPICPHSLSFRPVILPDSAQLELKIPKDARSNAWVSFDGKRRQQLSRGDAVRICMSQHSLPTVNKSDQTGDWFHSLVRCLNWNERLDQKAF